MADAKDACVKPAPGPILTEETKTDSSKIIEEQEH